MYEFCKLTNTFSMKSLYYLIPTFFILLSIVPFFFQVRITFSLDGLKGVFCIYIVKIRVKFYHYQIKGTTLILRNKKQTKEKSFEFDPKQLIIAQIFKDQIKNKARLKELFVFYNLGLDDAFRTSMVGGFINNFLITVFAFLKNKRPTASMGVYDTLSYNREVFEFAGKGSVSISLFDVAYSLLMSVILITQKIKLGKSAKK